MLLQTTIEKKINQYNPIGGLMQTAHLFLNMAKVNHLSTLEHCERVALMAEHVAIKIKKDAKAAFFLYLNGYGVDFKDFPKNWNASTIKKVLEVSAIISICDFVDAYTTRKTTIKTGETGNLSEMLEKKYPEDKMIIESVLKYIDKK